jgi:hypothetical protein
MTEQAIKQLTEQELAIKVAELPSEITPERDLWSGIERAIQVNAPHQYSSVTKPLVPIAWAASIVAAVLLTWVNLAPQLGTNSPLTIASTMQQDFEKQKQTLLVSFGQPKLNKLAPEMKDQLAKLASAQASINKALIDDPTNADLLNLLRWTQQQELDLLEQLLSPQWQSI